MANNDTIVEIITTPNTIVEIVEEKGSKPPHISEIEVEQDTPDRTKSRAFTGLRRLDSNEKKPDHESLGWDGEEQTLHSLGKLYSNILSFSIVTRYACYLLPVAVLLGIPLAIFATAAKNATAGGVKVLGIFVWLEIVWAGLWIAKLCSKTLPFIFQFLVGFVSAETRKHAELIKSLEHPLSLVVWAIVAWATVPVIQAFDVSGPGALHATNIDGHSWIWYLRRVLLACIPVSCAYFAEKLFIQKIAVEYHRRQFMSKINASKRLIDILTELYTASIELYAPYTNELLEEEDYLISNTLITSSFARNFVDKTGQRQIKVLGGIARVGNGVTSIFVNAASEVIGSRIDPTSNRATVIAALEKRASAEALARRIWLTIAQEGKDALYETDIANVLGPRREDDADEIFNLLDKDRNGDVSIDEMQMMLADLEMQQKAMVRSMHDVKQSIASLDYLGQLAVLVVSGVIFAAFFSSNFVAHLTVFTTTALSFSFAFAGTVQEFASSCIFIFSKHPYDVGDRIYVNGTEMTVKNISLLYTTFERIDNNRAVQIPNTINNTNWIENVSRSSAMRESFNVTVDAGTTAEDIKALQNELNNFVTSTGHKRDYKPDVVVDINEVGNFASLQLRIEYTHKVCSKL